MTDADIKYIIAILRRGTTTWPGRAECLRRHRRKVLVRIGQRGQPIYKYEWPCVVCKRWFRDIKSVEIDHVEEIGPFAGCFDNFVRRMYCGQENLVPLCLVCHQKKTAAYNNARAKFKRKR